MTDTTQFYKTFISNLFLVYIYGYIPHYFAISIGSFWRRCFTFILMVFFPGLVEVIRLVLAVTSRSFDRTYLQSDAMSLNEISLTISYCN